MVAWKKFSSRATLPIRATEGSHGFDLFSSEDKVIRRGACETVATDIGIMLPASTAALILQRSGLFVHNQIFVMTGLLDFDFRGKIKVVMMNMGKEDFAIHRGMRIAQILLVQTFVGQTTELENLPESDRGSGAFGSTGL